LPKIPTERVISKRLNTVLSKVWWESHRNEDAFFLYELFNEKIDRRVLNDYARELGVEVPF